MGIHALRTPVGGTPRSMFLLLALASSAVLAVSHLLAARMPVGTGADPLSGLEAWPAIAAAAIGIGAWLARARALNGFLGAGMALGLLLAASAALLQAAFAAGFAAAISAVSAVVFLALALLALDVALMRLAPGGAKRF